MINLLYVTLIVLFVGSIFIFFGIKDHLEEVSRDKKSLEYYENKIKRLQGSTMMLGHQQVRYNFLSFDGGKTWVEVDSNDTILRKANPKVLKHVLSINAFIDDVIANGPVNPGTVDGVKKLENAGFSVKKG